MRRNIQLADALTFAALLGQRLDKFPAARILGIRPCDLRIIFSAGLVPCDRGESVEAVRSKAGIKDRDKNCFVSGVCGTDLRAWGCYFSSIQRSVVCRAAAYRF